MKIIEYTPQKYLEAVRDQFSNFLKPEQLQVAMRTAAKRVAKHHGLTSKYDGQGRLREGFPAAGEAGGRVALPNRIVTMPNEKESLRISRRNASKSKTGRAERQRQWELAQKSRGPSRKMFVPRTDGGNGP